MTVGVMTDGGRQLASQLPNNQSKAVPPQPKRVFNPQDWQGARDAVSEAQLGTPSMIELNLVIRIPY